MLNLKPIRCRVSHFAVLTFAVCFSGLGEGALAQSNTIQEGDDRTATVSVTGAGESLTNNARITTTGDDGIKATGGANQEIINSGIITTHSNNARGISTAGSDATITNEVDGSIETNGRENSHGIISTGTGTTTVTNKGTVTTGGTNARGITVEGSSAATITNDGNIKTTGQHSHGIVRSGAGTTDIDSSGTITTSGENARGISAEDSSNAIIRSSSQILTVGRFSHGIISTGTGTTSITSSGIITTGGTDARGISAEASSNAIIRSSASILTTGDDSHGIVTSGTGTTIITSSAPISTTGDDSHGIYVQGADGAEIIISSSVSATGARAYAVKSSDGSQTLTILLGASITGKSDLGESKGDNDTLNIEIPADTTQSLSYSSGGGITGIETIYLYSSTPDARTLQLPQVIDISDGTVAVLDPTGSSAERISLSAATSQIHHQVFQRLTEIRRPLGTDSDTTARSYWGTLFGTDYERDADGLAQSWSSNRFGALGGYEIHLDNGQSVGLFIGAHRQRIETDARSIKIDTNGGFLGMYGQQILGDWDLKGVAIIGYESHNNARSILDNRVGNETADGNYRSIYISPSLELAWFYELGNGFDFQPSARVAYTYGRYGDYKESGTISSSLRFYDRDEMSIFDSRLQLALTRSFADDMGNISARGGTTYTRYSDNDIGVSRPNGGGSTSYRVPGDEAVNTRYVGASLRYAVGSMKYFPIRE